MAILILSISFTSCQKPDPILVPVGEARVVAKLENGNYEVTPAFLIWAYGLKNEVEALKLQVKKLQELLDKK